MVWCCGVIVVGPPPQQQPLERIHGPSILVLGIILVVVNYNNNDAKVLCTPNNDKPTMPDVSWGSDRVN